MIAQVISSITAPMRFDGAPNNSILELQTSLICYPILKFLNSSYAPIISHQKIDKAQLSTDEIIKLAFETTNMMTKCDPLSRKYMSCSILYRGDLIPRNVSSTICGIKTQITIRFTDWAPTGFKVGMIYQPQQTLPDDDICKAQRSACMISNTTAMSYIFLNLCHKYDLMFEKKAFVHWYIKEGMEEAQFIEAREVLANLQKTYEEADSEIIEEDQQENEAQ